MAQRRITRAQLERTIGVLGDLTTVELPQLDGATRDAFAQVIDVLGQLSDLGGVDLDYLDRRD